MKFGELSNQEFNINDSVTIEVKSSDYTDPKVFKLDFKNGIYKSLSTSSKEFALILPEYSSVLFTKKPLIKGTKLEYTKVLINNNPLINPLKKNRNTELFENGVLFKSSQIKIFPAYFVDRAVGLIIFSN
jgi:hypothetical protein